MLALGTPRPHIHEQIIACVFAAVAVRRASRLLLRVAPIRCCGSEPCKHCLQMPCKYCFQKDDEWKTHVILFYVSRGLVLHIYRNTYVAMPYVCSFREDIKRWSITSGNTLIAVSDCRVRRTTAETVTGERATAARTGS